MQSTSARAAASELMNKVAPTRIAEVASTSAHSLPSQTPFDAYATEASGWMPTEKAASVRPPTPPYYILDVSHLQAQFIPCYLIFFCSHPELWSQWNIYAIYRCRWVCDGQRWMWRTMFQPAWQFYLLLPNRLPVGFQRKEMHRYGKSCFFFIFISRVCLVSFYHLLSPFFFPYRCQRMFIA